MVSFFERKAVLYCRVSTEEQKKKGQSLQVQRKRLVNFCEDEAIEISHVLMEDKSGKNFNRDEWKRLECMVKDPQRDFDLVLVQDWDRYSRKAGDGLKKHEDFLRRGVEIQAISDPIDFGSPSAISRLSAALAEAEEFNTARSLNIANALLECKEQGNPPIRAVRGYLNSRDLDDKGCWEVNPALEDLVKESFNIFASGGNIKDVQECWKRNNRELCRASAYRMLRLDYYRAKVPITYPDGRKVLANAAYPSLVSEELFEQVQAKLDSRSNRKLTGYARYDDNYPLWHSVRCEECELPFTTDTKKQGRNHYYVCKRHPTSKQRHFPAQTVHRTFRTASCDEVPSYVVLAFREILQSKVRNAKTQIKSERTRLQGQLESLERERVAIIDKFSAPDSRMTGKQYESAMRHKDQRERDLKERESVLQRKLMFLNNLVELGVRLLSNPAEIILDVAKKDFPRQLCRILYGDGLIYKGEAIVRAWQQGSLMDIISQLGNGSSVDAPKASDHDTSV